MGGAGPRGSVMATDPDQTIATERRPASAAGTPRQGERVGRYIVVEEIGRGAMGIVLLAYDPKLHREIALKLLRFAGNDAHLRLVREAQAMAKLNHPNVVAVYDVDVSGEYFFVAMEYVPGTTLRGWMEAERRPWSEVVAMFEQAGQGLAEAHACGLVHRDFKPSNVLVGEDGRPRVTDFGLVRGQFEPPSAELTGPEGDLPELTTAHDAIMGTPAYMAPEQSMGAEVGPGCDQYAFCVALWEALHGERPFDGKSRAHLAALKAEGTPRPPVNRAVPRWVQQAIVRGLAPDPADRWTSMRELLAQLTWRPRRWIPAALGAVALGGLASVALLRDDDRALCTDGPDKIAAVWGEGPRAAIERSLLAEGSELATQTVTRVEARLSRWSEAWAAGHDEACRATHVERVQSLDVLDRRVACLLRMRSKMSAAVDLLAESDGPRVMPKAVDLVMALPDPSECADVERLLAAVPPPDDPATAEAVRQARAALDRVGARLRAGQPAQARVVLDELERYAPSIDYPAVHAEIDLVAGRILEIEGRFAESEQRIRRSFAAAMEVGDDARAATAAASLLTIIGTQQGRPAEGEQWIDVARALAARTGKPAVEGVVLSGVGTLAIGRGRYEEALEAFERQVERFEQGLDADDPRIARAHGNVAGALSYLGRPEQALVHMERSLALQRRVFGPNHPQVGQSMAHLGLLEHDLGRPEQAIEHMERGLAIASAGRDRTDPALEGMRLNLAGALIGAGRLDEAAREYDRVEAAFLRFYGPEHPHVALVLRGRAELLLHREQPREAAALFERALAIQRANLGDDHPDTLDTRVRMGGAWLRVPDAARAEEILADAVQRAEAITMSDERRAALELSMAQVLVVDPAKRDQALQLARAAKARLQQPNPKLEAFLAEHETSP